MGAYENSRPRHRDGSSLSNPNLHFSPALINAWLEAGFPTLGARALDVLPVEAAHWLAECERLEAARMRSRPIPGLIARRGRVYVE
jgi:hypothetical protein